MGISKYIQNAIRHYQTLFYIIVVARSHVNREMRKNKIILKSAFTVTEADCPGLKTPTGGLCRLVSRIKRDIEPMSA